VESVSGLLEPGTMTALMGPSGSGKTTLLDVLAGRKTVGATTGRVLFGGEAPTRAFLRRFTGYVEQHDTLLPNLTVRELLVYQASMKRPVSEPWEAKLGAVALLLSRLGLGGAQDTVVGTALRRGISGGEARRANIGVALITEPKVLFLDEPTSGLDSFSADEVVQLLAGLAARGGVTVCATIHSPTAFAFGHFDRVLMLHGGRTVYSGPPGSMIGYFEGVRPLPAAAPRPARPGPSRVPRPPPPARGPPGPHRGPPSGPRAQLPVPLPEQRAHESDVEYVVRATTAGRGPGGEGQRPDFARLWLESGRAACARAAAGGPGAAPSAAATVSGVLRGDPRRGSALAVPPWRGWANFFVHRSLKEYASPGWLLPRVADKLFLALLSSLLFLGQGSGAGQKAAVTQAAVLFLWTVFPAFGAAAYLPSLVLDRPLFYRERADGVFSSGQYLACKLTEEAVVSLPVSLAVCALYFYVIDLRGSFAAFWATYFLVLSCSVHLAYLTAAAAPTMEAANALFPTLVTVNLYFGGFMIPFGEMPAWLRWIQWLCFLRYGFVAQMLNQFGGAGGGAEVFDGPGGAATALEFYDMAGASLAGNLAALAAWAAAFAAGAGLALSHVRHQRR